MTWPVVVYTAGGDATVRGYDARSGTLRCEFVGHEYCVNVIKVCDASLRPAISSSSNFKFVHHLSRTLSASLEYKSLGKFLQCVAKLSAVYTTPYPSFCPCVRLSATLRYCVKTRERRGMPSSPSGSSVSLLFWCQQWLMGDHPVQVKLECKEVDPCGNRRAVHISPHNAGSVIDSKKVQLS